MHQAAADEWCRWEDALEPGAPGFSGRGPALAARVRRVWSPTTGATGRGSRTARSSATPAGWPAFPGVLVQGTLDLGNLIGTPWQLAAAWPGVELRMVDAAHELRSEAMVDALIEATDRFATG